jgi:Flp pilus assembly protein TadG
VQPTRANTFFRRRERGVAAVEFALILPLFLTILFAIMDFGWLFFQQLVITSAAREGARAGAVAETDSQATTNARAAVATFLSGNGVSSSLATTSATVNTSTAPKTISVSVRLQFKPLVGILFLPNNLQPYPANLNASAVMRREF